MQSSKIISYYHKSPLGYLQIVADDDLVYGINIYDKPGEVVEPNQLIKKVVEQLDAYFTGENKVFSLPLSFEGYTSFQKSVWEQLAKIPFGEVASYGELAKRVNNPKGARAVGNACGKNPFSIVIPCHRAIGSSGQLGGFSSGLDNKRWLLKYEGITTKENKKK